MATGKDESPDEEKLLIDNKTGLLSITKEAVNDPELIRIKEPESGDQYWTTDAIGSAQGATVYRAAFFPADFEVLESLEEHETFVAIKVFHNVQQNHELFQRVKDAPFLDHPKIVGIKTKFDVDDRFCVVMPYMNGGSIQSIISDRFPDGFSEECICIVLKETLEALSSLHKNGHYHKFVDAKYIHCCHATPAIKLAFGQSLYEPNTAPSCRRPAPEATENFTAKADIWLVGITALQLGYGLAVSDDEFMDTKIRSVGSSAEIEDRMLSDSFVDMVAMCLDPDPSRRPLPDELLMHGFFKNCNDVSYFSKLVNEPPLSSSEKERDGEEQKDCAKSD